MHGGMLVAGDLGERLRERARDCLEQAAETADPGCARLWHKVALDCLRIAAAKRESEQESVPTSWSFLRVTDCN
jgi:hypothetical protein